MMAYNVLEKDIANTVRDFICLCEYIKNNNPTATQAGALSVKPCYEINQRLSYPEENVKPSSRMDKYASVALWFSVAKESDLIDYCGQGKKVAFDITPKYNDFKCMNVFSQYLFIFYTWMCFVDQEGLYGNMYIYSIDDIFDNLGKCDPSRWQTLGDNDQHSFFCISPVQMMMSSQYNVAVNLMDLSLLECERGVTICNKTGYSVIKRLKSTIFGMQMIKACETRRYSWFNEYTHPIVSNKETKFYKRTIKALEKGKESFFTPFISLFPKGSIDVEAIIAILLEYEKEDNRVFDFNISLGKEFSCIIRCSSEHSFEDLHLKIQETVQFDNDHLYSFYLDGNRYSKNAVNAPYTHELPYTDETLLRDVRLRNNQRILYLFDYGDEWRFNVIVKTITETTVPMSPKLIEISGKPPEQYPSFDW